MYTPAAWLNVALPVEPTAPTSRCIQGVGDAGGPTLTVTFSNVAVAVKLAVWLDVATPMYTVGPIATVSDATRVQTMPSADW